MFELYPYSLMLHSCEYDQKLAPVLYYFFYTVRSKHLSYEQSLSAILVH